MAGREKDGDGPGPGAGPDAPGLDIGLSGPAWITPIDSHRIRSRVEVLGPGEEVGEHVTHKREEVVVFLEGRAEVVLEGRTHAVASPWALYIGPGVKHNIVNGGASELRYVYVVALHGDPAPGGSHGHGH